MLLLKKLYFDPILHYSHLAGSRQLLVYGAQARVHTSTRPFVVTAHAPVTR